MLEERIKRSAKKVQAPPPKQTAERSQRENPPNPTATFIRKPAQVQEEVPNRLK